MTKPKRLNKRERQLSYINAVKEYEEKKPDKKYTDVYLCFYKTLNRYDVSVYLSKAFLQTNNIIIIK